METDAIYELSICVDCYYYDQYGLESFTDSMEMIKTYEGAFEDGGEHLADDQRRDIIDGFNKLGRGLMSDRHDDDCKFFHQVCRRKGVLMNGWDGEKYNIEYCMCDVYFSSSPCDICESHLGGNRWDVVWTTFKTPRAVPLS
jgi:hypothetical protein